MSIWELTTESFAAFLLVLVRCSGIFGFSPVLSGTNVPAQVKVGLSFFLALVTYPIVSAQSEYAVPDDLWSFAIAVAGELLVGLCIGFVAALMMTSVQLAGNLVDFEMGFGMAGVVDPLSSAQTTIMGQFYVILATLLFIVVKGDHLLLGALVRSYDMVPLAGAGFGADAMYGFFGLLSGVFEISFKICAPIIACLFLATVGLGIVARTVPQMNVLMVGFPLKIGIGLFATAAAIPFVIAVLKRVYGELPGNLMLIVRSLGG
jgi:flagellar biosynthetic protein FliR